MKDIILNDQYAIRSAPESFRLVRTITVQKGKTAGKEKDSIISYHATIKGALEAFLQYNIKVSDRSLKDAITESIELIKGVQEQLEKGLILTINL